MRLLDLGAVFITSTGKGIGRSISLPGAHGVMFQCPKCAEGKPFAEGEAVLQDDRLAGETVTRRYVAGAHSIICWFENPADGQVAPRAADSGSSTHPRWKVSGTSLEDLTLQPSVSLDVPANAGGCRWHGYVTSGDAR